MTLLFCPELAHDSVRYEFIMSESAGAWRCFCLGNHQFGQGRSGGRCGAGSKSSPAGPAHVEGWAVTEESCEKAAEEQLCLQPNTRFSDKPWFALCCLHGMMALDFAVMNSGTATSGTDCHPKARPSPSSQNNHHLWFRCAWHITH